MSEKPVFEKVDLQPIEGRLPSSLDIPKVRVDPLIGDLLNQLSDEVNRSTKLSKEVVTKWNEFATWLNQDFDKEIAEHVIKELDGDLTNEKIVKLTQPTIDNLINTKLTDVNKKLIDVNTKLTEKVTKVDLDTSLVQPNKRIQFIESELNLKYNKYTIKNGIPNGDFKNDVPSNFGSGGTLAVINNKLRVTKPNDNPIVNLGIETDLPYRNGKYFFTMKVTPLTPGTISLVLFPSPSFGSTDIVATITNPTIGQEYTLTVYETLGNIAENQSVFFHLRGQYEGNTSLGSFEVSQPMAFDLTQIYGQGNEPTKEEFVNKLNNFGGFISTETDDYKKLEASTIDTVTKQLVGKEIVNFGDSIFGSYEVPESISHFIADKTGATVYNVGFAGCRMGGHYGHWDAFSMYRIADAITTGDFSRQDQAVIDGVSVDPIDRIPAYFPNHVNLLKLIDWSKVWAITIGYGTNDFYNDDIGLNDDNNPYEVWTYKGALRYSLEKIIRKYPHLKIIVLTPIYRVFSETENSDNYVRRGLKLPDFVEGVKDVSKEYHIPYFDGYDKLGFNQLNHTHYLSDGTHPNVLGNKRYGDEVGSLLINGF